LLDLIEVLANPPCVIRLQARACRAAMYAQRHQDERGARSEATRYGVVVSHF
jgi:hypothetical protein